MAVLVDLERASVRRVGRALFEQLSVTVSDGDRIGVVGVNGTGKSTLLRVLAGVEAPEEGVVRRGRGARVGFLEQEPELPQGTVLAAVGDGWEAEAALSRLGMGGELSSSTQALSGGQCKRVALARVLAHPADLLVLDEPTNHLDLGAAVWLEQRLVAFRGGLVLVTHDRHLLDRLTTKSLELDRGRAYLHDGGYEGYLLAKAEREEHEATAESTRRNLARRELAWLRRGAKARSRKPQARVDAALRLIDGGPRAEVASTDLQAGFAVPRLGDKVVECRQASFRYDHGPVVLSGVDLVVGRRERLGIVGANGTGKTTLLQLLAGRARPVEGVVETGPSVVVGYHDQLAATLDMGARVRDLVAGPHGVPGAPDNVNLMRKFLFTGDLPYAQVGSLSGGERRRLQLLLVVAARPNLLLLDEPTNDLDLDTLRALEDFLEDWPGALVVVSHDRAFMERVTDRLVALGEGGEVSEVVGGLDGWLERTGDGASRPGAARPGPGARAATRQPATPPAATPLAARERAAGPRPVGPDIRASGGAAKVPAGRQLRDAEKEMVRRQAEVDRVSEALAGASDYREMARLGTELADAQGALRAAEELWLALATGPGS